MASIEEVWGSSFPKKHHTMASKYSKKEEPRDAEREGRVFPTPIHRTEDAVKKYRKTIDDLSTSLPIAESDEHAESNYGPARIGSTQEHFSDMKKPFTKPFYPEDQGVNFPYAPPSFQQDAMSIQLKQIMQMLKAKHHGGQSSSQDMMLYIFTGVFFLFTLDTFVRIGKNMR